MTITLRPDQSETLTRLRPAYRRNRAVVLQASCGFGKTIVGAEIARSALAMGNAVTITVPRLALVDQTQRTLDRMGVHGARIDMVQTAVRREIEGDFLIADEAHYHFSPTWQERLKTFLLRGGKILGLTASPIPGMDHIYGDMVQGPQPAWLMARGHLSDYRAFGPSAPDLSGIPIHGGEYANGPLSDLMAKPSVTGDAVTEWLKFAPGLRTLGFSVSRKDSLALVRAFRARGISAEHIDGDTPKTERHAIAVRVANRETQFLSSVELFQLGYDLASYIGDDVQFEAGVDSQPRRSVSAQTQKWGRLIRKKPQPAIILDRAGNIQNLQMLPDSEIEWSIASGGRRKAGDAALAVSICHSCFGAFRTAPTCPYCGAERKLTPREVEQRDGDLAEIERQAFAKRARIEVGRAARSEAPITALAKIAKEKGHKPGWIVYRLKAIGVSVTYDQAVRAMRG